MRVRWLRRALANLDEEAAYVAQEDPAAAARMMEEICKQVDALAAFPASGRAGRVPGTRELVVLGYPFLVPYRVVADEMQILRSFHTRRKPPVAW